VEIHAVEDGLHDFAANVFEIDVPRLWELRRQVGFPVGMLVVDGDVEAEIVFNPFTFFSSVPAMRRRGSRGFSELADDAAGGSSGGGDDEGFAGLRLADFEEAK